MLEKEERTLLAIHNRHHELVRDDGQEIEFRLCQKRYVLPREDCVLLPIENVSVEQLAAHALELLSEDLGEILSKPVVTGIEVTVEEVAGQGATVRRSL